jgi:hypothetical protein
MLQFFVLILICSPYTTMASTSHVDTDEKITSLFDLKPESIAAELALAKRIQSQSPNLSSYKSGSLRRPDSQLSTDSGSATPTINISSSSRTVISPTDLSEVPESTDNVLGLLFN